MKKLPIVALIGQTNAGKSSLLNRLAHKNIAIVAREAGTTRDNVMTTIDGKYILIDTAGLKDPDDDFEASIQDQIQDAIESADLILHVVDTTKYPDHHDKSIAKQALRSKKPVLLVLNKSDLKEALPPEEFLSLGIKDLYPTSATTALGIHNLSSAITTQLGLNDMARKNSEPSFTGGTERDSSSSITLALIGRPNVGKSSLFNSLGKKQQALVSSRQGTTRDINRVNIRYHNREIEILDTAGLRKPGKREVGIEKFSAIRTLSAIEEADICALLIDATEPHAKLNQSLAGQIVEAGKGIIVVVTKIDLIGKTPLETSKDHTLKTVSSLNSILDNLERDFDFLPYAPVLLTSSETGKNITKLFDLTLEVDAARHTETKTSTLNKILREAIVSHPPSGLKNTHPKPKYIVQTDICPPWFVVHGREMELLHWSYKRYLERKIRETYPMLGTPIRLSFHNDH